MKDVTNATDEELLDKLAIGDEGAFVALYERRKDAIYRFAFHMSGSTSIAEEVTQEVFLVIIRDGKRYDSTRGTAGAYLFGIARNLVLRQMDRGRLVAGLEDEAATAVSENPFRELARDEVIGAVRRAVLALPPVYREAVVLCDLEEMSYVEAAEAIGCAIGTIRSRLNRGRTMLAQKLRALRPGVTEDVHELRKI